jgi:hypothetical protein
MGVKLGLNITGRTQAGGVPERLLRKIAGDGESNRRLEKTP